MSKNDAELNKTLKAKGVPPILDATAARRKQRAEQAAMQQVQPKREHTVETLEDEEYDEDYDNRDDAADDEQNDERDSRSHPSRPTRYSDSRNNDSSHPQREAEHFNDGATLPYIEPRPGFDQYWARINIALSKDSDTANYGKKLRRDWRPRKAETVPDFYNPDLETGTSEGNIRVANHLLMERPMAISEQFTAAKKEKTQTMTRAIHQSDPSRPKSNQYFGDIYVDKRKVLAEKGYRAVKVAD